MPAWCIPILFAKHTGLPGCDGFNAKVLIKFRTPKHHIHMRIPQDMICGIPLRSGNNEHEILMFLSSSETLRIYCRMDSKYGIAVSPYL